MGESKINVFEILEDIAFKASGAKSVTPEEYMRLLEEEKHNMENADNFGKLNKTIAEHWGEALKELHGKPMVSKYIITVPEAEKWVLDMGVYNNLSWWEKIVSKKPKLDVGVVKCLVEMVNKE